MTQEEEFERVIEQIFVSDLLEDREAINLLVNQAALILSRLRSGPKRLPLALQATLDLLEEADNTKFHNKPCAAFMLRVAGRRRLAAQAIRSRRWSIPDNDWTDIRDEIVSKLEDFDRLDMNVQVWRFDDAQPGPYYKMRQIWKERGIEHHCVWINGGYPRGGVSYWITIEPMNKEPLPE